MENQFFSEYFEFARSINTYNYITAVINTDYNERNINLLMEKQNEYRDSVNNLLAYAQSLSSISAQENKELTKLINVINRKADSIERSIVSSNEILCHYNAITKAINISFIVTFKMGESWNVNFTSSLRADRMDTHSNRFAQANATKNFLVVCSYPYQDSPSMTCINDIKRNPTLYGSHINVVCLEEFMDCLLYNIFKYKVDKTTHELVLPQPKDELAIVNGQRGNQIELMYASVLSNTKNFELYIDNTNEVEREQAKGSFLPNHYSIIVDKIFSDLHINPSQVSSVRGERVGDELKKADVIVTVTMNNGTEHKRGISLKSSSSENVSVHERHAEDFITYLGITDTALQDAFRQFEERKSFRKLDRNLHAALEKYYANDAHKLELLNWAIIGENHDPLNADYVMLHSYEYNSKEAMGHAIKIIPCQEYIDSLMNSENEGSLGTHLTWTYKGNIQLKAPFLFD